MFPRNSRHRCAALGLLAALVLLPTAGYAAPSSRALSRPASPWAWLVSTVQCALAPGGCTTPVVPPGALDLDAGCGLDPDGAGCRRDAGHLHLDAGCEIDPNGCLKH